MQMIDIHSKICLLYYHPIYKYKENFKYLFVNKEINSKIKLYV